MPPWACLAENPLHYNPICFCQLLYDVDEYINTVDKAAWVSVHPGLEVPLGEGAAGG